MGRGSGNQEKSLAVQKLLILIRSHLFIFAFISMGVDSKNVSSSG